MKRSPIAVMQHNTKKGQNSTKNQTSVSAHCWVVYSSSSSWYKSY